MSIVAHPGKDIHGNIISLNLQLSGNSVIRFQKLLDRALNCFPGAHPEFKEFSDMLNHGRVLQDYYSQAGMERTESAMTREELTAKEIL
jgi:hypothetical protein